MKKIKQKKVVEYDVVTRMPPIKKYSVLLKIKSIQKAVPKIVEPNKKRR